MEDIQSATETLKEEISKLGQYATGANTSSQETGRSDSDEKKTESEAERARRRLRREEATTKKILTIPRNKRSHLFIDLEEVETHFQEVYTTETL
jgi:hypothetical protein